LLHTTLICAMEARIIVNQKFTSYIKFIVDKTGWVIPGLLWCRS